MTYFKDFNVLNQCDLPKTFIKLSELDILIKARPINKQFYFSVDHTLQNRRGLSNVCIDYVNSNGDLTHYAYLYNHYHYMIALKLMLENPDNVNNYKLYIKSNNVSRSRISMHVIFYIKKSFMLDLFEKTEIPLIIYKLIKSLNSDIIHDNKICIERCLEYPTNDKNINLLRNPFHYQKENYSWMINLENKIDKNELMYQTFKFNYNNNYNFYYINELDDYICLDNIETKIIKCPLNTIKFYGGILADEIGLGKTFSMICLIKYQYKPENNSTLILSPKRLSLQWQTEINKSVNLSTFIIYNITQFRKYCKQKIKYDIIICSYEFLNSAKYVEYCNDETLPANRFKINTYNWERIILDEGHEYITANNNLRKKKCREISCKLHALNSKYRWVCSGTPFSNKLDFWEVLRFLTKNDQTIFSSDITQLSDKYAKNIQTWNSMISYKYTHTTKHILKLLCRQNTKKRVNSQVKIPKTKVNTIFLNMTRIEKAIYDSALDDIEKQYQLCNHILVSDQHINILGNKPLSFEEIHEKLITYYSKKINYNNVRIANIENKCNELKETDQEYIELSNKKIELEENQKDNKRKLKIFENLESKIKEEKNCPICFDDLSNKHNGVLKCGHFICCQCINKITQNNSKCPICREPIKKNQINVISPDNLKIESKLGTKITNLIRCCKYTIKQSDDNRIIIFSRWDSMLKLLSKILQDHDINHLILNGTYHTINSKLRKFKLDTSIRIILLSSEKAASGLNLTEANHIILLDTLNNDPDISKVIEEQAIGRAVRIGQKQNVKVLRFIMKDTVEEDFYNKLNKKYIENNKLICYDVLSKYKLLPHIIDNIISYL